MHARYFIVQSLRDVLRQTHSTINSELKRIELKYEHGLYAS